MNNAESRISYLAWRMGQDYLNGLLAHAQPALVASGKAVLYLANENRASWARQLLDAAGHSNIEIKVMASVHPPRRALQRQGSRYHS